MNFAAVDLNLLRVFDALMRERSATRAGERVGLSQPAISSALNRLRHITGDQLFVRESNRMVPTPQAQALIAPVQEALAQIEQALASVTKFDPAVSRRTFRLLGSDYFSTMLMPRLSARIADQAPGILLQLLDGGRSDIIRMLSDGLVDLALGPPVEETGWISRQVLFEGHLVAVAAAGHKAFAGLQPGDVIPAHLFCELPHALCSIDGGITTSVDAALAAEGLSRRVALTLPHFHATALAVAEGRLIGSLPKHFAEAAAEWHGLVIYRLPVPVATMRLGLYWHRRYDDDQAHGWMRDQITAILGKLDEPAPPVDPV
jgi:DNA-binding transcriptional LysR family regulator